MSLLSPWFLLGALAVSLPLWLHLLHRENPIRLPFSSLMFFEKRQQRTFLEKRFRYLLLLAMRLALLLLAALIFAKPVWERPPTASVGDIPKLQLIAIDTSLSMQHGDRRQLASDAANAIIADLPPQDRAQILAVAPSVSVVIEPTSDQAELREAVASLQPGFSRNSYGDVVEAARSLAGDGDTPVELHVVSDFQHSAMPGRFSELVLPTAAALHLHNVAEPNDENWAIESVKGTVRVFGAETTKLEATVAGFAADAARKTLTLTIDGQTIASESREVPAMGRASFVFEGFEAPAGYSRAELKLTPADDLPADDVRLVALDNSEPAPILFITSDRRRRDAQYFETALRSSRSASFRLEVSSAGEAERKDPKDYAAVVISDAANLSTRFLDVLQAWVEQGGAALVAVGPNIVASGKVPLGGQRAAASPLGDRSGFRAAGEVDRSHPALASSQSFRGVKFFRYARIAPSEEDRVPARLGDGSPLLLDQSRGDGRIVVFASAFDNVWNDLPVRPVFVSFAVEATRYLAGSEGARGGRTVDETLELSRRRDSSSSVQVFDPNGDRALSLAQAAESNDVALSQVGYYEVRGGETIELVAVNPDPRESNTRGMDEETLELWRSTGRKEGTLSPVSGEESNLKPPPWRIWRWLLFGLVAIMLLESVIGNRHLNIRREA